MGDYAAWRGRDPFILSLLAAGADPTDGEVPLRRLAAMPRPLAAWIVRAAARMRQRAALLRPTGDSNVASDVPAELCGACGSTAGTLVLSPCGHFCCPACVWRDAGDVLHCPVCSIHYSDPATERRTESDGCRVLPLPDTEGSGAWACPLCFYYNRSWRRACLNCDGQKPDAIHDERSKAKAMRSAPGTCCLAGVVRRLDPSPLLKKLVPRALARWFDHRIALQRRASSKAKWMELPAALPAVADLPKKT